MKFIQQHDEVDCGAACIAMIASYYHSNFRIENIRSLAGTNKTGTTLFGLKHAAENLGFKCIALEGKSDELARKVRVPFIAHVQKKHGEATVYHYVVVKSIINKKIRIYDPAEGRRSLSHKEFNEIWTGYLLIVYPDENREIVSDMKVTLVSFFPLLFQQKQDVFFIILSSLFIPFFGIISSLYFKFLFDEVINGNSYNTLFSFSIGIIVITLFRAMIELFRSSLLLKIAVIFDYKIITQYLLHVLHLPLAFFDNRKTGEILSRIEDSTKIRQALAEVLITLIMDSVMIVVVGIFLMIQSSKLFAIAIVSGIISTILALIYSKLFSKSYKEIMEQSAQANSFLFETTSGIETIKAFNATHFVLDKYEQNISKIQKKIYLVGLKRIFLRFFNQLIDGWSSNIIYWIGCYSIISKLLSLGELISFTSLLVFFLTPLQRLLQLQPILQEAYVAAERIGEIIEIPLENSQNQLNIKPDKIYGHILLKNVTFSYNINRNILNQINLEIEPGKQTAFIGNSGCGKTTLIKLILKFYHPTNGSIQVDGYNIDDIDTAYLRTKIGYVPQDILLLSGTIAQNIALHRPDAQLEEIIEASKRAFAHDFIEELDNRYNTVLGERGKSLSGGEKQRIALARALLNKPDILIFDEATSNLDSIAERKILNSINVLRQEKITILLIAHRLSTIKNSDKIVLINNGQIIDSGEHSELFQRNIIYRQMWDANC